MSKAAGHEATAKSLCESKVVLEVGSNARMVDGAKNGRGKPQIRPDADVSNSRQEQCAN